MFRVPPPSLSSCTRPLIIVLHVLVLVARRVRRGARNKFTCEIRIRDGQTHRMPLWRTLSSTPTDRPSIIHPHDRASSVLHMRLRKHRRFAVGLSLSVCVRLCVNEVYVSSVRCSRSMTHSHHSLRAKHYVCVCVCAKKPNRRAFWRTIVVVRRTA